MNTQRLAHSLLATIAASMALCVHDAFGARALQDPPKAETPAAPVPKLTAWPKVVDKDQVLTDIERVVKAAIPEMASGGHTGLVSAGASAFPLVLERFGREKDEAVNDRLEAVLIEITAAEHTRLLAKEFAHKLPLARTFCLWRAARFPDAETKKEAEAAWARVQKQGDKADPEEKYCAALACTAAGSILGLETLFAVITTKQWDKRKPELRVALPGARSKEATEWALAKLEGADRKGKVAVLRLLAGCGDKSCAPRVKGFLDEEDNSIRVAAINALRGIVDNEPPLEDLSAFEAIETAKKWKART